MTSCKSRPVGEAWGLGHPDWHLQRMKGAEHGRHGPGVSAKTQPSGTGGHSPTLEDEHRKQVAERRCKPRELRANSAEPLLK